MFRRVVYSSGGLYAVQGVYMLLRRVIWIFSGVISCSEGLYAVEVVIIFSRGLFDE